MQKLQDGLCFFSPKSELMVEAHSSLERSGVLAEELLFIIFTVVSTGRLSPEARSHEENAGVRLCREPVWPPWRWGILTGLGWLKKFLSSGHWSRAETFLASLLRSAPWAVLTEVLLQLYWNSSEKLPGLGGQESIRSLRKQMSLPPCLVRQQFSQDRAEQTAEWNNCEGGNWTGECKILLAGSVTRGV